MLTGSIDPFTNFLWLSGTANKNAVEISLHFGEAYEMGNPYYGIPFHYQTLAIFFVWSAKITNLAVRSNIVWWGINEKISQQDIMEFW